LLHPIAPLANRNPRLTAIFARFQAAVNSGAGRRIGIGLLALAIMKVFSVLLLARYSEARQVTRLPTGLEADFMKHAHALRFNKAFHSCGRTAIFRHHPMPLASRRPGSSQHRQR